MNHDETNPHPDMKTWIDPELEARVVAWVAGEASAFEIAELERMCAEKPELAVFKRRIEAVQGLVGEAARPDAAPLQLSAERRAKLLATFGATTETPATSAAPDAAPVAVFPAKPARRKLAQQWQWMVAAAACVGFGALLLPGVLRTASKVDVSSVSMRVGEDEARVEMPEMRRKKEAKNEEIALMPLEVASPQAEAREEASVRLPLPERDGFDGRGGRGGAGGGAGGGGALAKNNRMAPAVGEKKMAFDLVAGAGEPMLGVARNEVIPPVDVTASGPVSASAGTAEMVHFYIAPPAPIAAAAGPLSPPLSLREHDASAVAAARAGREVSRFRGFGNVAAVDAAQAAANPPPPRVPSDFPSDLVAAPETTVQLAPFAVRTDTDRGYAAGSTISGTRLNTSLADKASSITVTTKQQLVDTPPADLAALSTGDAFAFAKDGAAAVAAKERDARATDPAPPVRQTPVAPVVEETRAAQNAISTFSLHVSDVSFRLAQTALARGELPAAAQIRPEEFYNAFDYGDPAPAMAEKIGARIEQAAHPVLQQRNLVRLTLKVPATGRAATQALRLTVLLDTSGSMEREDRVATVRRALGELVALLGAEDRVTLIGFARQPRLLAEAVRGNQAGMLVDLLARTPAEGGTNLEEALKLAGQLAQRHRVAGAQNRIVLLTDGAANLGNANPAQLATAVETLRQQGIAFDACGIGLEGLDDGMLETLTRRGDGRYYVLDSADAADAGFARQLAGAFRPAAENVKVQVRFNPARVGRYRLIGFDQHRLRTEDFRNDAVDAAELAAEEAAVALYEVEALPQGSGELGELFVRFRDAATGAMVERSWTMSYEPQAPAFDRASPSLQLAGVAVLLAEKLRQSPVAAQFKLADLAAAVNGLRGPYAYEPRVQELVTMFAQARRLTRE